MADDVSEPAFPLNPRAAGMPSDSIGRQGRPWRRLVASLKQTSQEHRRPCFLCGQRIDYRLPGTHLQGFTAHHVKPWSLYPELREDPANLAPTHRICNLIQSNREGQLFDLGSTSRDW